MGKYISYIITVIVIFTQISIPFAYAQVDANASNATSVTIPTANGTQAQTFNNGAKVQSQSNNSLSGNFAADAVGCSVGQILGNIVQSGVSAVISSIKGYATGAVGTVIGAATQRVPITNPEIEGNTAKLTNKEVGGGATSIASFLTSVLDGTSFDSIGFCLANATVHYIAQSTINWINSGFEGNPAFVDNPGQFFQDMADIELGGFVQELGLGFMCSGVAPKIRIAIVNDYLKKNGGKSFNDRYKCSFDQIGTNVQAFVNNYSNGGTNAFVEFIYNPASRPSSAYLAAQEELKNRISAKQGAAQFELRTSDFMSYKKCDEVSDVQTRQIKKVNCKTYTPGSVIQQQLESTLNLPKDRLAIADEFDEVVAALVNQLIKTALSEVTTGGSTDYNQNTKDIKIEDDDQEVINIQDDTNNQQGYKPTPIGPVAGTCRVSTTTVAVDQPVTFEVVPRGGNGSYIYDWLGASDFPTSTASSRIVVTFASTTPASNVSVRVKSGNKAAVVKCPAVTVVQPVKLEVSCAADDTSVSIGDNVTWKSNVTGGTGYYTYEWKGDISPYGNSDQNNTTYYNEKGTYKASVRVTSGAQVEEVDCDKAVKVK